MNDSGASPYATPSVCPGGSVDSPSGTVEQEGLFNLAADPLITVDASQCIVAANPAAERFFGYGTGELAGLPLETLLPYSLQKGHRSKVANYLLAPNPRSVATRHNLRALCRDGQERLVDVSLTPFHTTAGPQILALIIDTEVHQVEKAALEKLVEERTAALSAANQRLEQELASRHQVEEALQLAKELAETSSQAKSIFLANMSHEIRTPLTAIIGFAESLLESGQSMSERLDSIHTIIRNGRHLQALISDILDISKVEAGRLTVEQVSTDLFDLLKEIEATASSQASTKGLEFTINYMLPLPRTVYTDPTRLRQILLNLCNNAVKFTETGSVRLIVSCDVAAHQLITSVFDSGIGLSNGQRDNLFKPFVQADVSTTRRYGGTGLGLHISRRLAELLGGTVRVESLPGSGSLFVAVVDTGSLEGVEWAESVEDIPTVFSPMARLIRPRRLDGSVLLAEDSPDNQRLISLYLRRTGARVTLAEDGRQAVEQALEGDFDLVLMDMQMPVLDGPDATALLRATGFGRPIVALTANASVEDRERCQAVGCNDFLTKPVDWEQFYRVMASYLPEAAQEETSFLPPIAGLAELTEDPEYQAMADRFLRECPERVAELRQVIYQRNWEEVRRLAHRLKGVAGGLGMPELGSLAGDMEFQAIRGAGNEVAVLLESMECWCHPS